MKCKGIDLDFSEVFIVWSNSSIEDVCDRIYWILKEMFKYVLVWGVSVRYVLQRVGLGYKVLDEDVVYIVSVWCVQIFEIKNLDIKFVGNIYGGLEFECFELLQYYDENDVL